MRLHSPNNLQRNGDHYNATNPPYDVDLRDYFVAFEMFEDNLGNLSPFSDAAASPNEKFSCFKSYRKCRMVTFF